MIIISARFEGPELEGSRIDGAISAAMKAMMQIREPKFGGTLGKIPHVNVVFVVEGSLGKPEFDSVRIGPYSRKEQCVQVDIAMSGSGDGDLRHILMRGLRNANAAAFHFFADKGIEFPLRAAEELVTSTGRELVEFA